jgi:hypothetical protein
MLIDPFHANWLTDLTAHHASLPPGAGVHLLIDGAFRPGLFRELDKKPLLLFESLPGCSEETRDVSPFVLKFEPTDHSLRRVLSRSDGFPMVSAITTFETAERLAERLAAWCVVEADGQRFNFRFSDTRRLPDIFGVLTNQQRGEIVGNAIRWRYMGRDGKWSEIPYEPHADEFPITARAKLDAGQFKRLISDSEPDEMWARLEYRGETTHLPASQRHALLSSALSLARERKINGDDTILWCAACLSMNTTNDLAALRRHFATWITDNMRTNDDDSPVTA